MKILDRASARAQSQQTYAKVWETLAEKLHSLRHLKLGERVLTGVSKKLGRRVSTPLHKCLCSRAIMYWVQGGADEL